MTTQLETITAVTAGVDTHRDVHMVAALDQRGAELGVQAFGTDPAGHHNMLAGSRGRAGGTRWCRGHRHLRCWTDPVPATQRHRCRRDQSPDRQERRSHGKSDEVDAIAAARAAQSGKATAQPKTRTGNVEAIRALRMVRRSATRDRTSAINQMRALVVTGPDDIRETFRGLTTKNWSLLRPGSDHRIQPPSTGQPSSRCASWPAVSSSSTPRSNKSTTSSARSLQLPHPNSSPATGSASKPPRHCSLPPATTQTGYTAKQPLPTSAAALPSMRHQD